MRSVKRVPVKVLRLKSSDKAAADLLVRSLTSPLPPPAPPPSSALCAVEVFCRLCVCSPGESDTRDGGRGESRARAGFLFA